MDRQIEERRTKRRVEKEMKEALKKIREELERWRMEREKKNRRE